jgi:hypothetical protein
VALTLTAAVLLWAARPGPSTGGPDSAVVSACAWAAWVLGCYLLFSLSVAVLAAVARSPLLVRLAAAATPRLFRRIVAAALGVGVTATVLGGATPALADRPAHRASTASAATSTGRPATTADHDVGVVVGSGDCLWTIAAGQLGARATAPRIAARWPRWWHANRIVIGPDPDVLVPGERLLPPIPHPRSHT